MVSTAEERQEFEAVLRRRLEEEAARMRERIETLRAELQPLAPDCALGRQGRIETQAYQAVRRRELEAAQARLDDAEDALVRFRSGRYGYCARCAEPIAPERLLAQPQTRFCAVCADERAE